LSLLVCAILLEGRNNHDSNICFTFKDPGFGNTSEITWDLQVYPIPSEWHINVALERWKGNSESLLLFVRVSTCAVTPQRPDTPLKTQQVRLLSATLLLFIVEGYSTSLPQDVVDQAVALFNQVTALDQPLGPDAVPLECSAFIVRATTLWLLSLWLIITCVVLELWRQRWQQCIELLGPLIPARLRPYLFPGVGTRLCKYRIMVEENWVLLDTSVIIFLVGLVDFSGSIKLSPGSFSAT